MKFYEIPETKLKVQDAYPGVQYSVDTKATRRKAAVRYASHSISRGNMKKPMPRSFTFVPTLLLQFQAQ